MKITLHRGVPVIHLRRLVWGRGFATPFFICLSRYASRKTLAHEYEHFRQWWRWLIVGFAVIYLYDLFRGFLRYRSWYVSYKNVRFERWARAAAGQHFVVGENVGKIK